MCQMSVVLEDNGEQKTVLENVTYLEAVEGGISVNTLFAEPTVVPDAFVQKIDFMGGTVTLAPLGVKKDD